MALLNEEILRDVTEMLADMTNPVKLVVFTDDHHCDYCEQIVQLVNEVAATSDRIQVELYEIHRDADKAAELAVKRAPVVAILGDKDYGMRFYGIPSGYEFSTLLHAIQAVGRGHTELDQQTRAFLNGLDKAVDFQVFVTPTCPYCPRAAVLAMHMAMESDKVNTDVVEASEFPDLANQYNVMGVPLNVINDRERVEGAAPPQMIVDAIRKAIA